MVYTGQLKFMILLYRQLLARQYHRTRELEVTHKAIWGNPVSVAGNPPFESLFEDLW